MICLLIKNRDRAWLIYENRKISSLKTKIYSFEGIKADFSPKMQNKELKSQIPDVPKHHQEFKDISHLISSAKILQESRALWLRSALCQRRCYIKWLSMDLFCLFESMRHLASKTPMARTPPSTILIAFLKI